MERATSLAPWPCCRAPPRCVRRLATCRAWCARFRWPATCTTAWAAQVGTPRRAGFTPLRLPLPCWHRPAGIGPCHARCRLAHAALAPARPACFAVQRRWRATASTSSRNSAIYARACTLHAAARRTARWSRGGWLSEVALGRAWLIWKAAALFNMQFYEVLPTSSKLTEGEVERRQERVVKGQGELARSSVGLAVHTV